MNGQMSRAQKKKQQQTPKDDFDDDLEWLMAQAKSNQDDIAKEVKDREIPDEVFKDLPPPPRETYPDGNFPVRDYQEYNNHVGYRPNDEQHAQELAELEEALPDLREGGIIHEQVRQWAVDASIIKPGVKLFDMCAQIEEAVRRQIGFNPPVRGLAFPCGCSLNNCAAHYSPLPGDERTLGKSDVMKIDFGVSVNGMVIDSAFTVCFDPRFEPLIAASREATNKAVRMAGAEVRISELSAEIEEVISSYQLEIDGRIHDIHPVSNLTGHQMARYKIHSGKFIPIVKERQGSGANMDKMEVGELFALETFATTGRGVVCDDPPTSHFMLSSKVPPLKAGRQRDFVKCVETNFKTLAFCQRFIDRAGQRDYARTLDELVTAKIVHAYPPLSDEKGSWVSQHEHCFAILPKGKEVFSRTLE